MTRRFVPAFAAPSEEPISAMNTTPLIDVMLVLLIMFIITIPITSHKVALDLPTGKSTATPKVHLLDMDRAGRLYWDGVVIKEAGLPSYLDSLRQAGPESTLHFRADGESRYEDFDRVLATIKRAGIERLGLVGNDRFAAAGG